MNVCGGNMTIFVLDRCFPTKKKCEKKKKKVYYITICTIEGEAIIEDGLLSTIFEVSGAFKQD